jgi:hypothetical protein
MNTLPPYFGIFRPGYGNATYFCLAKLQLPETIDGVNWQPISFVTDPPAYEFQPAFLQAHCEPLNYRVMWHNCCRLPETLRNMMDGQTFYHLPFKVSYQGNLYPVLFSLHTSWLPSRVPEFKKRTIPETDIERVQDQIALLRIRLELSNLDSESESDSSSDSSSDDGEGADHSPHVNQTIPLFVYENHVSAEQAKGTQCPITMTELRDCNAITLIKDCFHIFDKTALAQWFTTHDDCPTCRTKITGMLYYAAAQSLPST